MSASRKQKTDEQLKHEALRYLNLIGVRPNLKGYHLLSCAIVLCRKNSEYLWNLTTMLYPAVGQEFGISAGAAEQDMRRAISIAYRENPRMMKYVDSARGLKPCISEVLIGAMYFNQV